jgi:hypothetical protein
VRAIPRASTEKRVEEKRALKVEEEKALKVAAWNGPLNAFLS